MNCLAAESLKLEAVRMFDRLEGCILEFKDKDNISADNCLELLISVIEDVFEKNGIDDVSALKVSQSEDFLSSMYSVLSAVSDLYEINKKEVLNFSQARVEKFHAQETKALENKKTLVGISADIEQLKKERAAENEAFLAEKIRLESQIEELNNKNSNLRDELDRLNDQYKKNTTIKDETESGIADKKERIAAFEKWEAGLDEKTKQLVVDYERINARVQSYVNVWAAESKQQFLHNTLFGDNPLSDVKDFKDIFPWFDALKLAIQDGLSKYQEKLQQIVKVSENLTKG
jgi:DNA repair exonuclease SbcCD ATPase subunit